MKLPLKYHGELEVEENAFECIVDAFIYREFDVAFQFTCNEPGYCKSEAFGIAIKDSSGRFITTEFRLRYASDKSDTPAQFTIGKIEISKTTKFLKISAIWRQAGDSFLMKGKLEKVRS